MDGDSNLREDSISGYRIYYNYQTSVLINTLSHSPRVVRNGATVIEALPLSVGPMAPGSAEVTITPLQQDLLSHEAPENLQLTAISHSLRLPFSFPLSCSKHHFWLSQYSLQDP